MVRAGAKMTVLSPHSVWGARRRPAWLRACLGLLVALLTFGLSAVALAAPPAADGRVHVKYWEKWTGGEKAAMQALVDDFNRSQSRITVDYLSVSSVNQKTLVATAGGNPPDL